MNEVYPRLCTDFLDGNYAPQLAKFFYVLLMGVFLLVLHISNSGGASPVMFGKQLLGRRLGACASLVKTEWNRLNLVAFWGVQNKTHQNQPPPRIFLRMSHFIKLNSYENIADLIWSYLIKFKNFYASPLPGHLHDASIVIYSINFWDGPHEDYLVDIFLNSDKNF